jgi:hypothetical protein
MMRVCELAKKMRTSSLEVLKQADALDIEAYSPLSSSTPRTRRSAGGVLQTERARY